MAKGHPSVRAKTAAENSVRPVRTRAFFIRQCDIHTIPLGEKLGVKYHVCMSGSIC